MTPDQQRAALRATRLTEIRDEIADIITDHADCPMTHARTVADMVMAKLAEMAALK